MSRRARPERNVRPVSDLGAAASEVIKEVQQSGRPLVVTEDGQPQAVILGATEYAQMLDTIDLLNDIVIAEGEIADGEGIPHEEVKAQLLAHFRK